MLGSIKAVAMVVGGLLILYVLYSAATWLTPMPTNTEPCNLSGWNEEEQRQNQWHGEWFGLGGECR